MAQDVRDKITKPESGDPEVALKAKMSGHPSGSVCCSLGSL